MSAQAGSGPPDQGPLAIICGGGTLPFAVADAVQARGRDVVLFALRGWADPQRVAAYRHHWVALGQFGWVCRQARAEGCRDIVFIGTIAAPAALAAAASTGGPCGSCRAWRPPIAAATTICCPASARLSSSKVSACVGAHEVAPEILMPAGTLGNGSPMRQERADIGAGPALLEAIGKFDVGQAAVVAGNHVLAVEGAEGTDQMLARVAELRGAARSARRAACW